jgi:hypothetical protein
MEAEKDGGRVVREDHAGMRARERENSDEVLRLSAQASPNRGVNVRAPLDSGQFAPRSRACEVLLFGGRVR